ncbi:MAG: tetratricopeptide repeat protein [Bacteroidales bacterium]|jgi:tetratricopeptide (TPR) repeat protein|nr:tetratricopeptide repeat protein [Bacteroidales bacterium]
MNTRKLYVIVASVAILISSCTNEKSKINEEIGIAEETVFGDKGAIPDKQEVQKLLDLYSNYFTKFPEDTLNASHLFKAAELNCYLQEYNKAIALYDTIPATYPGFGKNADCMFMKAYVYDAYLQRINKARIIYTEFIEKYPTHEFADDAQMALLYLGKSNEEILETILKNAEPTKE